MVGRFGGPGAHRQHLPHDLDHYIIEARLRHPYGFWSLVGQQAPFDSLTLVTGRWPKGKTEWFERVKRKHRDEMVQAEAFGIDSLASGERDIDRDWKVIRRKLTRGVVPNHFADVTRAQLLDVVDFHREVHREWDALPMGESMAVTWPPVE